jgi:alpha-L-rhamnosidase
MKLLFLLLITILFANHICIGQTNSMEYKSLTYKKYRAQTIIKISNHHYLFVFKKAYFGKLELTLKASEEDTIIVKLGEKLTDASTVDTNPPGTIRYLVDKIILSKGTHTYITKIPSFQPPAWAKGKNLDVHLPDSVGNLIPFRYVEIIGYKGDLIPNVQQIAWFYPFNDTASYFNTSSDPLNKIWDLCKHTIKATSFAGVYIDGDRERRPYEGDAYINQLSHYAVDNEYGLARKTIDYLFRKPTWPTEWHYHMHLMLWEDYMYTGKDDYLKLYYDSLKRIVDRAPLNKNGLVVNTSGNDIIDWPQSERDGYQVGKVNNVPNAFHYKALQLMVQIAGVIHKQEDAVLYAEKAEKFREVFNELFWNKGKKLYIDAVDSTHSSVHANFFPIVFGLASQQQIDKIMPFVKTKGMAVSVYGAQYLLDALYMVGEDEYAQQLITADGKRSWINMIKQNGTITWESWNEKVKPNLDWNHAWGAAPGNIIARRLFGIRPLEAGFRKVLIQPQFGLLQNGKIVLPTIQGPIKMEFDNHDKNLVLTLNMVNPAKLILPVLKYKANNFRINNELVKPAIEGSSLSIDIPIGENVISIEKN